MFLERLLNQGNAPLLERMLEFTEARNSMIADNIANVSTPGYHQKDLSLEKFQTMLRERAEMRDQSSPGSVGFDDIDGELTHPTHGILFHDGNNRPMEEIVTQQAKNALMHNLAVELLRKQYAAMDMALKEHVE